MVTTMQTKDMWGLLSVNVPFAHKLVGAYDTNYVFPLYNFSTTIGMRSNLNTFVTDRIARLTNLVFDDSSPSPRQGSPEPDVSAGFAARHALPFLSERGDLRATLGVRDVFDWVYAVLYAPSYRERYADFLKADFARVPLPKDRAFFDALVPLGTELVALHLLDPVGAQVLNDPKVRFVNPNGVLARLDGRKIETRRTSAGRAYVNDGCWFETVPESVWNRWIGGYQPAQKWLKDRAAKGGKKASAGRVLTPDDQLHYRRMIVALERTAEIMTEIDQVIDRHGGWPGAFKGMTD